MINITLYIDIFKNLYNTYINIVIHLIKYNFFASSFLKTVLKQSIYIFI